ncbi:MAG: two-component system response regulator HupR/HoxA [Myxococcota bacterium]
MLEMQTIEELAAVRRARDLIRKWWRLEVGFADARGYVVSHANGIAIPPPNGYCRAALSHSEGFKRCDSSVAAAMTELRVSVDEGAQVVMPCHLGFPLAMAPVARRGRVIGCAFVGGFLIAGHEGEAREAITHNARALHLAVGNERVAQEEIPLLDERDLSRLGDLLEVIADELAGVASSDGDPRRFGDLIGNSPKMQRLYLMLDKVAKSDTTVLIIGENGTGKEVVARSIHEMGPRGDQNFVATNCAALADTLLETELFGHVKGAFTGAIRDKPGLFQVAHGGTLFLDEVGDTSPAMQVKLLRVLQEGTFIPVGATSPVSVDVRVLAATNRPLRKMVENGSFREDLYYRLNVIGLQVPPLRERKSDLRALCDHFTGQMAKKQRSKAPKKLSEDVMRYFWEFDWPGNVRQLENEIERLTVLSGDAEVIGPTYLSPAVLTAGRDALESGGASRDDEDSADGSLEEAVRKLEQRLIREGLVRTGWNKSQLSKELGVSRTTLIKKVKEMNLRPPPKIVAPVE